MNKENHANILDSLSKSNISARVTYLRYCGLSLDENKSPSIRLREKGKFYGVVEHSSMFSNDDFRVHDGARKPKIFIRTTGLVNKSQREAFMDSNIAAHESMNFGVDPYGGNTIVTLIDKDSRSPMGHGEALCYDEDEFSRERGFEIAMSRALKSADLKI